jgi:TM2 domain-containing membrane protein YozV
MLGSTWMIQLEAKRIVASGVVAGIVVLVLSMVVSTVTQVLFDYNVMALAGMRLVNDPVSILFFAFPFVIALVMAVLYDFIRKSFAGTATRKGILLGLLGWMVYGIPSAFIVFSSMDYPFGFTVNSVVGSLVYMLGAGITITKLSK